MAAVLLSLDVAFGEFRVYLLMAVKYIRVQFLFGPALTKVVTKATPQELKFELELDSLLYVCVCDSLCFCLTLFYTLYNPQFVSPSI